MKVYLPDKNITLNVPDDTTEDELNDFIKNNYSTVNPGDDDAPAESILAAPMRTFGRGVKAVMDPIFNNFIVPALGSSISGAGRYAGSAGYLADKVGADSVRDSLLDISRGAQNMGGGITTSFLDIPRSLA